MRAPMFVDIRLEGWTTFRGPVPDDAAVNVRFAVTLGHGQYFVRYFRREDGVVLPEPGVENGMSAVHAAIRAMDSDRAGAAAMIALATELERLSHQANDFAVARVGAQLSDDALHFSTDGKLTEPDNAYWTFDRVSAPGLFGEWWEVKELYDDARNVVATFNAGLLRMSPEDLQAYFHHWMAR